MKRQTIVAANWKMNGGLALVKEISAGLSSVQLNDNVNVIVCPSAPYLAALHAEFKHVGVSKNVYVGAQNVSEHLDGAYTGEISTEMLKELSVDYVILGHSERRSLYKETSTQIAHKVKAALNAGLTPILCVGESEAERVAKHTEIVIASQLQPVIDEIGIEKFINVIIAYEPVWAIGTGKTASPEMAQATHKFIREFLTSLNATIANQIPLLYGGSVNAENSEELFAQTDIDGGLIGGASLKVEQFTRICSAAKGSK